jgi:hypothetical protein
MPPPLEIDKKLRLPPGFAAQYSGSPWAAAVAAADAGEAPGTLFYAVERGLLDAALILAPHRPVEDATVRGIGRQAMLDALAGLIPPGNSAVALTDETVAINGGAVGRVTIARGPAEADGTPVWLVLGFGVRLAVGLAAPGLTPWLTDLAEEGIEIAASALLESLCRHLLAGIDLWQAT